MYIKNLATRGYRESFKLKISAKPSMGKYAISEFGNTITLLQ
jgi:hypothetical protein